MRTACLRLENRPIGGESKQIFGAFRRDRTQLQSNSNQGTLVPWKRQACRTCAGGPNWPGGPNRKRVSHRSREPLPIDGVQAGPSAPHLDGTEIAKQPSAKMARSLRLDARVTSISQTSNDRCRPSRTFFGTFTGPSYEVTVIKILRCHG